jgi:hypothetical protein
MMAEDVVAALDALSANSDDAALLHHFLARIRAWQDFMRRGDDGMLSPEAELGLYGELEFLEGLISCGLPAMTG